MTKLLMNATVNSIYQNCEEEKSSRKKAQQKARKMKKGVICFSEMHLGTGSSENVSRKTRCARYSAGYWHKVPAEADAATRL